MAEKIYKKCVRCSDGVVTSHTEEGNSESDCEHCGGTGICSVEWGAVDLDELLDKCDDILDKCNDIFEKVNE